MNNYLTEKTLVEFCKLLDKNVIHNRKFLNHRFRPDCVSPDLKLVIEFDGYHHYTKSSVCYQDLLKDNIIKEAGYRIIRIPYFVQLDKETEFKLFGTSYLNSTYKHGFIDKTAILPADFCSMGIKRFESDLDKFYWLKDKILSSLIKIDKPKELVYY